jgi:hypothetical protein
MLSNSPTTWSANSRSVFRSPKDLIMAFIPYPGLRTRCQRAGPPVAPALLEELEGRSDVKLLSDPAALEFSAQGELLTRV